MHNFFQKLAAGLRGTSRRSSAPAGEPPAPASPSLEDAAEALAEVLSPLLAVMEHPKLGGPGFLTVRFPADGDPVAAVQFPNINEALYQRLLLGEPDPQELIAAGVPAELFDYAPSFEAESGGMVLLSVGVGSLEPGLAAALDDRRERGRVLGELAGLLWERYPQMEVRALGGELMLAPRREGAAAE